MQAMTIVYDQQLGRYYRLNKHTGQAVPAEKNGQPAKKFKMEYTGRDYLMRKVSMLTCRKGRKV